MPSEGRELTEAEQAINLACRQRQIQSILHEFHAERDAQYAQWGVQDIPLGFSEMFKPVADLYRILCDDAHKRGELTMRHILLEEFFEALAESNIHSARDELVQVGACIVQTIQLIDKARADG